MAGIMGDLHKIGGGGGGMGMPGMPGGGGPMPGMGAIPPGMDKEAEQMWAELTKMAKDDPDKYDDFIAGQVKDAQKEVKQREKDKPKPAVCVESWGKEKASTSLRDEDLIAKSLLVKEERRVVVSLCGSDKLPPLSSTKDGSVPILLRDPIEPPGDSDQMILFQAVFHPGVIVKTSRDAEFKKDLIGLCWECVADKCRTLTIDTKRSREVTGKAAEALHKLAAKEEPPLIPPGMIPPVQGKKKKKGRKAAAAAAGPAVLLPGSAPKRWPTGTTVTITGLKSAAQHNGKRGVVRSFAEDKGRYVVRLSESEELIRVKPDNALLEEMPAERLGGEEEDGEGGGPLGGLAMPDVKAPVARGGGMLIEEVKRYLKHHITRSQEPGSREMVVSIPMPGRRNAKGVDLSVSATELVLEGVDGFEALNDSAGTQLRASLPAIVDTAQVAAKFDKKAETLRVTLQVVSENSFLSGENDEKKKPPAAAGAGGGGGWSNAPLTPRDPTKGASTATAADFAALSSLLGGGGGGGGIFG